VRKRVVERASGNKREAFFVVPTGSNRMPEAKSDLEKKMGVSNLLVDFN
jgi:hypothetical protein